MPSRDGCDGVCVRRACSVSFGCCLRRYGTLCCGGGCRWELIKKLCSDLSPYLYNTLDLYKTTPCLRNLCDDFHDGTLVRRDWDMQTFEEVPPT